MRGRSLSGRLASALGITAALSVAGTALITFGLVRQYAEQQAPWKLVKTDKDAAKEVLFTLLEPLRAATIVLKPFLPRSAETIYTSFNFVRPWAEVHYEDAAKPQTAAGDLRVLASLVDGKVKPLFPRIG